MSLGDIVNVVLGFDCCYYEIDENDPDFYEKGELMEMIDGLSNIMDKCVEVMRMNTEMVCFLMVRIFKKKMNTHT